MLNRIDALLENNESFAFETTLSTRSYKQKIEKAKLKGYTVTLLFFWLASVELAKERVKNRVAEGGHNIELDVIERRYYRGLKNLFDIYLPLVDRAMLFDNSSGNHKLIAHQNFERKISVIDEITFKKIKNYHE